jgi:aryl-alcohol dehydrogenase-like predicted oxidoreductase
LRKEYTSPCPDMRKEPVRREGARMEIERRRLGRTELPVTAMGLGCYQLTGEFGVNYGEADRILDYALSSGVNYVDTAQMYGFGESEELVGRALRRHAGSKIHISDKVGYLDRTVARAGGDGGYRDPVALKRAIKHSLWLLQRAFVDIFMIHEPDRDPWWQMDCATGDAVVTDVLEDLKKEGVIGAIGLGGWDSEALAKLCDTGRFDVALNAGGITLFDRPMFRSLIPAAKKNDVGIVVGGVLGQGFSMEWAGKDIAYAQKLIGSDDGKQRERGRKLLRLYEISDGAGVPMLELALRYALSFPEIHCHIPGARCEAHVRENLAISMKGPLPADVTEAIIAVSEIE